MQIDTERAPADPVILVPVFNSDIGDTWRVFLVTVRSACLVVSLLPLCLYTHAFQHSKDHQSIRPQVVHTIIVELTLMINRYTKAEQHNDEKVVVQLNLGAFGSEIVCELSSFAPHTSLRPQYAANSLVMLPPPFSRSLLSLIRRPNHAQSHDPVHGQPSDSLHCLGHGLPRGGTPARNVHGARRV